MQDLREKINLAFAAAYKGPDNSLAYDDDWESDSINQALSEYIGRNPPDNVLEIFFNSLPGLRPPAFRYFLRFYLDYTLRHPDSDLAEMTVAHLLSIPSKNAANEYWCERLRVFDSDQRSAVANFLRHMVTCADFMEEANELMAAAKRWEHS